MMTRLLAAVMLALLAVVASTPSADAANDSSAAAGDSPVVAVAPHAVVADDSPARWGLYYVSTRAMGCYDDEGSTANPHCDHVADGYVYDIGAVVACGLTGSIASGGIVTPVFAIGCGLYFIG